MAQVRKVRKPKKVPARYFWTAGQFDHEPALPLPYVDYWKSYANFLGFSAVPEGPYLLCECARPALANAIELERVFASQRDIYSPPTQRLPLWAATKAFEELPLDPLAATAAFRFGGGLCHRCNLKVPSRKFCQPMYGGAFRQAYGWYISVNYLAMGVKPVSLMWAAGKPPPDLARLLASIPPGTIPQRRPLNDKVGRDVDRYVENITREQFGTRPIGEGWVSETLLGTIVQEIFPGSELHRHFRPEWLSGLELDIWLPEHRVAFEYQGQQHFQPVKAWGGQPALLALQERDRRKAEVCSQLDIRLVVIDYGEPLTSDHVRQRLAQASSNE